MKRFRFLAAVLAVLMILTCQVTAADVQADFDGAIISVSDLVFTDSDQAELVISLDKVPDNGIVGLKLRVHYDNDCLDLVNSEVVKLFGNMTNRGDLDANPFVVLWDTENSSYKTGKLMTLTFSAKDPEMLPAGEDLITVECAELYTYAADGRTPIDADYKMNQPAVYVASPVDADGNGSVNTDDALYLLRHSLLPQRYPVEVDVDLNGDGSVDGRDAELLYEMVK